MESILEAAAAEGACAASWILLRLPFETKALFEDWLQRNAPGRRDHVLGLLRQSRGGRLNDPQFGTRFRGTGAYAQVLETRFRLAARKLGLVNRMHSALRTDLFRRPAKAGDQLTLF
jgi:DNA repair photolyase